MCCIQDATKFHILHNPRSCTCIIALKKPLNHGIWNMYKRAPVLWNIILHFQLESYGRVNLTTKYILSLTLGEGKFSLHQTDKTRICCLYINTSTPCLFFELFTISAQFTNRLLRLLAADIRANILHSWVITAHSLSCTLISLQFL